MSFLRGSNLSQPGANPNADASQTVNPQVQWEQEQQQSALAPVVPETQTPVSTNPASLIRTTQYGWASDNPRDRLTTVAKVGNHDNPLTPHVAALSDAEAKELNAKPGDVLQVGNQYYYYGDRAPEGDKRVDLYQPQGLNKNIPDFQAIKNLGGGDSHLKGRLLAQAGESAVSKFQNAQPVEVETTPPIPANTQVQTPTPPSNDQASVNTGNGINFLNVLQRLKSTQMPVANLPTIP